MKSAFVVLYYVNLCLQLEQILFLSIELNTEIPSDYSVREMNLNPCHSLIVLN